MLSRLLFAVVVIGFSLTVNAQTINVNVRGKVSDESGKAISGAIVTLVGQGLKDTTNTDGTYAISTATALKMQLLQPEYESILPLNGGLAFALPKPSAVMIRIFEVNGKLLKKEYLPNVSTGFYRFDVAANTRVSKLMIIKATVGQTEMTFRYLPLSNGKSMVAASSEKSGTPVNVRLAKLMAINDTIKVTATGYTEKKVPIESYDKQLNITLAAIGGSTGSLGCGKTLGAINKSGTYTITTSGKNRTYMVRFPSNYDKANPYRLIFGMHCMGASAQDIYGNNARSDGAYNFYRLGSLATNAILVAPQGPNSNGTWGGQEDHKFFEDLLDLLKDTLCIDTARVFSVGFSYGAMFTYSLSLNHQDQLRAVVCFAPYDGVIWLPTNSHKPIAFMQTTGMSDNTCGWSGAKGCATKHAEDNDCDNPTTIPTSSGQYLVHDFKGCKEGYPVKVVTFGGGHTAGESWMPQMAWDFLKQF